MATQIVFNVDPQVKAKAMKRAKAAGIPFASYLRRATEAFAEGEYGVEIVRKEVPNTKTARALRAASDDFKKGKNISPRFSSGEDMDEYVGI